MANDYIRIVIIIMARVFRLHHSSWCLFLSSLFPSFGMGSPGIASRAFVCGRQSTWEWHPTCLGRYFDCEITTGSIHCVGSPLSKRNWERSCQVFSCRDGVLPAFARDHVPRAASRGGRDATEEDMSHECLWHWRYDGGGCATARLYHVSWMHPCTRLGWKSTFGSPPGSFYFHCWDGGHVKTRGIVARGLESSHVQVWCRAGFAKYLWNGRGSSMTCSILSHIYVYIYIYMKMGSRWNIYIYIYNRSS